MREASRADRLADLAPDRQSCAVNLVIQEAAVEDAESRKELHASTEHVLVAQKAKGEVIINSNAIGGKAACVCDI